MIECENFINLETIIKVSPRLKFLTVENIKRNRKVKPFVDAVVEHPSLTYLSCHGAESQMKKIFANIKMNFGNLKVLRLHNTDENLPWWQRLEIEFPENPNEWDKKQELDFTKAELTEY